MYESVRLNRNSGDVDQQLRAQTIVNAHFISRRASQMNLHKREGSNMGLSIQDESRVLNGFDSMILCHVDC